MQGGHLPLSKCKAGNVHSHELRWLCQTPEHKALRGAQIAQLLADSPPFSTLQTGSLGVSVHRLERPERDVAERSPAGHFLRALA